MTEFDLHEPVGLVIGTEDSTPLLFGPVEQGQSLGRYAVALVAEHDDAPATGSGHVAQPDRSCRAVLSNTVTAEAKLRVWITPF